MGTVRQQTSVKRISETTSTGTRLSGWLLFTTRVIWGAFSLLLLSLFLINLLQPAFGGQTRICPLTFTCPAPASTLQILKQAQIPLAAYNTYVLIFALIYALIFLSMSVLLFWRTSEQPVGLLASFAFLFMGFIVLIDPALRLPLALQVVPNVIQVNGLNLCLGFFLVMFPDGRFVPRWSWLIGCTLFLNGLFFQLPGPLNILSWPFPLIIIELILAYGSPIAMQVYRYRRASSPAQRQQTRWVIFGLTGALVLLMVGFFSGALFPPLSLYQLLTNVFSAVGFLLIPLSISIAILRSRLWDIDVIIHRTLVYGVLTVLLALIYVGLVLALSSLAHALTGQAGDNPVAIVVSTLAIAALFQPLRRRIQTVIDRRFYRRKYNAARTVADFSATLRSEVDLARLSEHLVAVVQETMQPTHVSLWLRRSDQPANRQATNTSFLQES